MAFQDSHCIGETGKIALKFTVRKNRDLQNVLKHKEKHTFPDVKVKDICIVLIFGVK